MGTILDKAQYINVTKGLIKDAANSLGAGILLSDTFRAYPDKISAVKTAASITKVTNAISGSYNNVTGWKFYLVVPEKDGDDNYITGFGDADFAAGIKTSVYGIFLPTQCIHVGNYGKNINGVEEFIADGVTSIPSGDQIVNGTSGRCKKVSMDSLVNITTAQANLFGSDYTVTDLDYSFAELDTINSSYGLFQKSVFTRLNVPKLAHLKKQGATSSPFHQCTFPASFVFPALEDIEDAFGACDSADHKIYFPALTALKQYNYGGNFKNALFTDIYLGPNLASIDTYTVTNLNGITGLTIHTSAGVAAILTAAGVSATIAQDYEGA